MHQNPAQRCKQHKIVVISGHSRVLVARRSSTTSRRPATPASTSPRSAPTRPTGRSATRTAAARSSVTRPSRATAPAAAARSTPTTGAPTASWAPPTTRSAPTASPAPPTTIRENSTTTFRDNGAPQRRPQRAARRPRRARTCPRTSSSASCTSATTTPKTTRCGVPAANANGEFAGDRIWRNTGIAANVTTNDRHGTRRLGVGRDPDPGPVPRPAAGRRQAAERDQRPPTRADDSWLLDEGRQRATVPPPGQPGTVNAVKYTRAQRRTGVRCRARTSGRRAPDDDPAIQQATYNILSDMGVQPDTPDEHHASTRRAPTSRRPPPSRVTPSPAHLNQAVTFNALGVHATPTARSSSTSGTSTATGPTRPTPGTTTTVTKTYTTEGNVDVHLRVTDNGGATDFTTRTRDA